MQLLKLNDLTRVGRNYDGGYVISEGLMKNSSVLLSFGINDDWSFEEDFCRRSGVGCYGFDFSIYRQIFLERSREQIRYFFGDILKRGRLKWERIQAATHQYGLYRSFGNFFRKNTFLSYGIDNTSHGQFRSLDDILREYFDGAENIFLKVDIEGFEYRIIGDIVRNQHRFHNFAMEVHGIHQDSARFQAFLEKIGEAYYVYHIHANNYGSLERQGGMPEVIEISCVRKGLVKHPEFYNDLEHLPLSGLDYPNDPNAQDFKW